MILNMKIIVFDSESDWDTASEAETHTPKRLINRYPKIDRIAEVPEEYTWNKQNATPKLGVKNINELKFKQYTSEDEDNGLEESNRNNTPKNTRMGNTTIHSSGSHSKTSKIPEPNLGDFRSAITEPDKLSGPEKLKLPGKERKGNLYDPVVNKKVPEEPEVYNYNLASWDSDEDAKALADLRAGFEKGKKVEAEAKKQIEQQAIVLEVKEPEIKSAPPQQVHEAISPRTQSEGKALRGGNAFFIEDNEETRIIYPFEDGHKEFYHAVENPSKAYLPQIADSIEAYIRRGWQEFFAALRILTGFVFIFIVELLLFVTRDTLYKLLVKVIVIIGNFLVKPLLSNIFNALVQPLLIFLWNIFDGVRNMLEPVIDIIRGVSEQVAIMLGSFRLVNVNWNVYSNDTPGTAQHVHTATL